MTLSPSLSMITSIIENDAVLHHKWDYNTNDNEHIVDDGNTNTNTMILILILII